MDIKFCEALLGRFWNIEHFGKKLQGFRILRRHGVLMVSTLNSRVSSPGLSPGWGHCVVFLGKTSYFHSASLHPGVLMATGKLNAGSNPAID